MLVPPAPIGLLVVLVQRGEGAIFAMVLFCVRTIRLIFMIVPFMIVVILFVMIAASDLVVLGSERGWHQNDWNDEGDTQQRCIQKTGHMYITPIRFHRNRHAKLAERREVRKRQNTKTITATFSRAALRVKNRVVTLTLYGQPGAVADYE